MALTALLLAVASLALSAFGIALAWSWLSADIAAKADREELTLVSEHVAEHKELERAVAEWREARSRHGRVEDEIEADKKLMAGP